VRTKRNISPFLIRHGYRRASWSHGGNCRWQVMKSHGAARLPSGEAMGAAAPGRRREMLLPWRLFPDKNPLVFWGEM